MTKFKQNNIVEIVDILPADGRSDRKDQWIGKRVRLLDEEITFWRDNGTFYGWTTAPDSNSCDLLWHSIIIRKVRTLTTKGGEKFVQGD
jgi:hypothetical protein